MKTYKIVYIDATDMYEMNGKQYEYIGEHLYDIAEENNLTHAANSESHHLAILRAAGLDIQLLEEDGSKLRY